MRLVPLELVIDDGPLPPRAAGFLNDAQLRIDRWFARDEHQAGIGFIPSSYKQVWHALAAVRHQHAETRRMLEWGSGFGVVAGFAELLGFDAYGIEIDQDLVAAAEELLGAHGLLARLAHGSFVPASFDGDESFDLETRTEFGAPDAYDELGLDLDDFDVVFAYPWPTEEDLYCEMFRRNADFGAVLLTWSRQEGARAYRKVAGDWGVDADVAGS